MSSWYTAGATDAFGAVQVKAEPQPDLARLPSGPLLPARPRSGGAGGGSVGMSPLSQQVITQMADFYLFLPSSLSDNFVWLDLP